MTLSKNASRFANVLAENTRYSRTEILSEARKISPRVTVSVLVTAVNGMDERIPSLNTPPRSGRLGRIESR